MDKKKSFMRDMKKLWVLRTNWDITLEEYNIARLELYQKHWLTHEDLIKEEEKKKYYYPKH